MSEWRPIQTAPKDGTLIWAYARRPDAKTGFQGVASFLQTKGGDGAWFWRYGARAVFGTSVAYWRPLPDPPE